MVWGREVLVCGPEVYIVQCWYLVGLKGGKGVLVKVDVCLVCSAFMDMMGTHDVYYERPTCIQLPLSQYDELTKIS